MVSLGTQPANRKSGFGHSSPTGARAQDLSRQPARPDLWGARVSNDPGLPDHAPPRGHAPAAVRSPSTVPQCVAWRHPALRLPVHRPAPSARVRDRPTPAPSTPPADRSPPRLHARPRRVTRRTAAAAPRPASGSHSTAARAPRPGPQPPLGRRRLRSRRPSSLHPPRLNHSRYLLGHQILP